MQCLKTAAATGSQRASAIGNLFFNVLSLQCATPTYPKICVENGRRRGNRKEEGCARWAEDLNARPSLRFIKPRRLF